MKVIKRTLLIIGIVFATLFALVVITGNNHLFLGVYDTYLKGRTKPGVHEPNLFPYRTIAATNPIPWEANNKFADYQYSPEFNQLTTDYGTKAFLVIENGKIIHEKYFGDYTDTTISNSFSMAKSVLAVLAGIAETEGTINTEAPAMRYVSDLINDPDSLLRIKHLINMTSGMNYDEDYGNPFGFMAKAYYGSDLISLMKGYDFVVAPGTEWRYKGGNNILLSVLLQRAAGMSISEYAELKLWGPIGATTDARWILDHKEGYEKSFSGYYATAKDFAKIGWLYMSEGKLYGNKILDSSYVAKSLEPTNLPDEENKNVDYYGYAWWLTEFEGEKVFYMRGILGQYVLCIPSKNRIVVRLGEKRAEEKIGNVPTDVFSYLTEAKAISEN